MTAAEELSHRDALLREGFRQLSTRGYHGTTVDGLLEASGVPKGSFYHHFKTKEAFAVEVLARYGRFHSAALAEAAMREDLSTPEKLGSYFAELSRLFVRSGHQYGDLVGKLSTEVATTSESLRDAIGAGVRGWREQLEQVLLAGQERGDVRTDRDVRTLSAGINALVDGAFMVAMSTHDTDALDAIGRAVQRLVAPAR